MHDTRAEGITPEHLASLSHEFRTPLNGVIGMARLLDTTELTAEQRAYVAALMQSGEHLLGLVNDVLDYAKLGAGRVDLHLAPVALDELLRSVAELMSPKAHEKGLEIGWAVEGGVGAVQADEGRLRQILLNLLGNAVKFTERGGVLLTASHDNGVLRLTVSDTGPGVPAQAREGIFEAFQQADEAHAARGAGLGLAIVRQLARAMRGDAGVDGAPGSGADFWVTARVAAAGLATAGPAARFEPLEGRRVGVASPNAIVREAAARQLEAAGARAIGAASLDDVLARASGEAVLLVDHSLAARGRVALPKGRRAIVLLRPEERGLVARYRADGFAGYLIKPLRAASLAQRVLAAEGAPEADAGQDERIAPAAPLQAAAQGKRVLLAEDNPINAMLARTLLTREGCQVDHVADGEAALAALAAADYDLILMDVRMPVLSGLEATHALRARGVTAPVVALTANAFEDDRRACLAAGMNDFLVKPLSPEALRAALLRWTGGWTAPVKHAKVRR
jgi:CheY-like chemotaxis protein/anti-sigma regulatory factor (Ser/Thr protein kinase)